MIIRTLLFIKLLGLLCWAGINTALADTVNNKPLLAIEHWQTSQGAPVYFVRNPELPMVDVQILFIAGSAYDDKHWGLANLVASTLNEGSKQHDADQIAEAFDQVGAQFSSQASRDVAVAALRSLSDDKYLGPALDTFTEVISQPTFSDQALQRVKQQTISAISEQQQKPLTVAMNTFYQNLYPHHPYGHPVLGTADTVNAITPAQVQNFYQRYWVSQNAQIILVGNLDRPAAEKLAERLMAALPAGTPAPKLAMADNTAAHGVRNVSFSSQQTAIVTGQLGMARENPDYFPLVVGNYLLGQMPLDSLLFQAVRNERGLAYDVSSTFSLLTYRGPFAIVLRTRTGEKQQALEITQKTLRQFVKAGPSQQSLQLAKQNIINNFPLNFATNENITSVLMQLAINHRPLNYFDTYRDNVKAVTPAQIQQAFQNLIHPDRLLTVTVGG